MNLLANRSVNATGKIAHLRQILQTQEPRVLAELVVTPAMAEPMLCWFDSLPPHMQELVAMEWNADFRSWVFRFAAFEALQGQGLHAFVERE